MPALSPTMTEGRLATWHKREGDTVKAGDVIAEIETDKATMELEAVDGGTLARIVVPAGAAGVKVNSVIAVLLEEGEDKSALDKTAPAKSAPKVAEPVAATVAKASAPPPPVTKPNGSSRVLASPLARKLAKEQGIDLASLQGSGPGGRVVQRDLSNAKPGASPVAAKAQALPSEAGTLVPHNNIRRITAERLAEAWRTIPHIYLNVDCVVDGLMNARAELNARAGDSYKLSVNDFVIRAVAFALRKVPEMNSQWTNAGTLRLSSVDVAIAVALPHGLITPIIRRADQKGLAEISGEMKVLAEKARAGKLMPEEYQGGGFTISNLGMYGIKDFGAIVNPPQAGILAVGTAEKRPVVKNGALAIGTVLSCTLSCDHRVVDGAIGAQFLTAVKGFLEEPMTMLL
jgi:pyruvate dehydrogenase E2 component (dihydrolipoamide acetyltransferase)